jgi:hypothetical protein
MSKGKFGQDLSEISDSDFADFLLKFAFMTDAQLAERDALPTKEARKAYVRNLPLPKIGGQ